MTGTDLVPVGHQSSFELLPKAHELSSAISQTEFVPKALRNRPEAVMAAMLTGHEVGIGPMQALSKIHVIEGRPAMSSELMRALVLSHGHDLWIEEKSSVKVTVCGQRRGSEHITRITWTMDDAKRANLNGKQVWRSYPRAMLMARATAELVRDVFPDVLGGISYSVEEVEDGFLFDSEPETSEPTEKPKTSRRKAAPAKKAAAKKAAPAPAATPPPPPLPNEVTETPADDDVVDAEIVEDRGVSKIDVAQLADEAFASYREAAPRGKVTRTVERLRRAVTWIVTSCRTASLKECTPEELAKIHARLEAIRDGKVTVTAEPLDDQAGVTFTVGDQERTVAWSEWEAGGSDD